MAVLFIILEQPVQQKFRGGHAEQADTLEFSLCASIAPDRRPLSECAKRTSLGRRSGNRRRSARSTKFHSVSAVLYDRPGTSDLIWFYEANFYYFESRARPPSVLRDILKGEPRHWRYAESAFLPEPVQRFYYSAENEKMQRYSSFFMASMR